MLEVEVGKVNQQNIDALKAALITGWNKIPLDTVRAAVDIVPRRLEQIVQAKGGHIE